MCCFVKDLSWRELGSKCEFAVNRSSESWFQEFEVASRRRWCGMGEGEEKSDGDGRSQRAREQEREADFLAALYNTEASATSGKLQQHPKSWKDSATLEKLRKHSEIFSSIRKASAAFEKL
eukprot:5174281-Pleurochrysis_carterae.AAC.1